MSGEDTLKLYHPTNGGPPRPQLDILVHAVLNPYAISRKREAARAARHRPEHVGAEPGRAQEHDMGTAPAALDGERGSSDGIPF